VNNVVLPIPNLARRLTTEERTMMTSTCEKRMRTCLAGKIEAGWLKRRTLSSMTCWTRSLASRTLRISSSSVRTRPPTRSAVRAVTETLRESADASVYSPSMLGRRDWRRVSALWIGSWSLRSVESEVDSSASSDSSEESADRTWGSVVSVEGDGRNRCCCCC
jgi:hypothetical protein